MCFPALTFGHDGTGAAGAGGPVPAGVRPSRRLLACIHCNRSTLPPPRKGVEGMKTLPAAALLLFAVACSHCMGRKPHDHRLARRGPADAHGSGFRVEHRRRRQPQRARHGGLPQEGHRQMAARARSHAHPERADLDAWRYRSHRPEHVRRQHLRSRGSHRLRGDALSAGPDGITGEAQKTLTVRTRAEPKPAADGRVFHVYPPGYTGPRQQPAFSGLLEAYYMASLGGDWSRAPPPRVRPGDTIKVHAGLYLSKHDHYSHE